MTRRAFACIVSAVTVALVAGCGKSGTAASSASRQVTKAQALAYAHAVNLRAGDVAGTTSTRNAEVVISPSGASTFLRCAGIPGAKLVLEIHSTILSAPYWWIRSTVGVMPSAELAAAYVSAIENPRDRHCLRAASASRATLSSLAAPPPIMGFRSTPTVGVVRPTHTDTFDFDSGRVVVALIVQGEHTPPLTTEQRVASLLYRRVETNKL